MKTKLIATNDLIEFKLTSHDDGAVLNYEGEGWTEKYRGQTAAILKDDGNGIVITVDDMSVPLDYCQARYVYLLLKNMYRKDSYTYYKKVKS